MNENPSRNAEDYTPSTHYLQRKKYRHNPPIPGWLVSDVIETGEIEPGAENRLRFVKEIEYHGRHYLKVVVDPQNKYIVSAYCYCHNETKADCHAQIRE